MGNTEKITEKMAAWINYPALVLLFLGPYFGMLYQLHAMEKSLPIDPALEIISHSVTGAEVFRYDDQILIKIATPFAFHFEFNRKLNPSSWNNEKVVFQIEPLSGATGFNSIVPNSEDYKKVVLNSVINQLGEYQLVIAPGAILKTMGGSDLYVSPDLLKEPIKFKIVNDFFAPVLFQPNINNLIVDEKSDEFINYTIDIPKFMKKPNLTVDSFVNNADGNLKVFKVDGIPDWESDTRCNIKIKPSLKASNKKKENLELAIIRDVVFEDKQGNIIPRNSSIIARNVELIRQLDPPNPPPKTYTELALTGTLKPPAIFPATDPVKYRLIFNQPISFDSLKNDMFSDIKGKNKVAVNSINKVGDSGKEFDIEISNQEARNKKLALQKVQNLKTVKGEPIVLNTDIVSSDPIDMPPKKPILVDSIRRDFQEVETDKVVYYDVAFNQDVNTDSTKRSSSSVNTDLETIRRCIYNKDPSSEIEVLDVVHDPINRRCFRVGVRTNGTKGNIKLGINREKIDFRDSNNNLCGFGIENLVERDSASIIPSLVSNTVTLNPKSKEALVGQDVQYDLIFSNQFGIKPNSLIPKMFDNKIGPKARISNIQPNGKNGFTLNATLDQPGSLQLVLANGSELETIRGTKIGFKNDIKANQNVEYKSESFKGKVILVIVDTKFLRDKNNAAYFDVIAALANQPSPNHPDKPQILTKKGLIPWDGKRLQALDKDKDMDLFDSINDNAFNEAWNLAQKEIVNRNNNNPISPFLIWADGRDIQKFQPIKINDNVVLHLVSLGNNRALNQIIVKDKLGNSRWLDFKDSPLYFVESLVKQFEIKSK